MDDIRISVKESNIEDKIICFCGDDINISFGGEYMVAKLFLLNKPVEEICAWK